MSSFKPLTASNSLSALTILFGALMSVAVCLVRRSSEVHTVKGSRHPRALMQLANACAYNSPRGDREASPPIRPSTLYSLSPCWKLNMLLEFQSILCSVPQDLTEQYAISLGGGREPRQQRAFVPCLLQIPMGGGKNTTSGLSILLPPTYIHKLKPVTPLLLSRGVDISVFIETF